MTKQQCGEAEHVWRVDVPSVQEDFEVGKLVCECGQFSILADRDGYLMVERHHP